MTTNAANTPSASKILADGSVLLTFSQMVKKDDCVACEKVANAEVVYTFDKAGVYQRVQLVKLTPVAALKS